MGIYADLLASAKTFAATSRLAQYLTLRAGVDPPILAGAAAINAVHTLETDATDTTGGTFTLTITNRNGSSFTTAALAHNIAGGGANDAVHTIVEDATDHTGGTFTLTVLLANGETFTTAAIAYNADAATIEAAIDTAASGQVSGWSAGDISVAGTNLQTADITLTFDGTSVSGQPSHALTTLADSRTGGVSPSPLTVDSTAGVEASLNRAAAAASFPNWSPGDISVAGTTLQAGDIVLTFSGTSVAGEDLPITVMTDSRTGGAAADPLVTITTAGQSTRNAMGALMELGILSSSAALPLQRLSPPDGSVVTLGPRVEKVPSYVVQGLMEEAANEDQNNNTYHTLNAAIFAGGGNPPQVETIGRSASS